ncbi:Uncharacterised protein [Vibrio cholerae]|nr:Uncharacterised protein [Vibrio cholerae]CSI00569.1 Uncharacterised protein [Vibrio cholerae]CSI82048.1 Uncharacterised protein [Vibrio cholerae]
MHHTLSLIELFTCFGMLQPEIKMCPLATDARLWIAQ